MNRSHLGDRGSFLPPVLLIGMFLGFSSNIFAQTADLSISKSGPGNVAAGTDITYTISVDNISDTETNLTPNSTPPNTLSDTLPTGTTFVSADYDAVNWTCTLPAVGAPGPTASISCTRATPIPPGESSLFTFVFHADPNLTVGTMITNTASIAYTGSNASDPNQSNNSSSSTATVFIPPPPPLGRGEVLISEFRLQGPAGASDEYIELYCNRDTDCNVGGLAVRTYDPVQQGDFSASIPGNATIPARQYALLIGSQAEFSLFDYVNPDFLAQDPDRPDFFADNQGVQLVGEEGIIIDSIGFIDGGNADQYIEGTGLQPATGSRLAEQYAYVRKRGTETNGLPQDTNDNANDFVLVSVTGNPHPGIATPLILGAPGPKSLTSPLSYDDAKMPFDLVEPANDVHATPNRVRTGSGDSGTLSLRRSFTNNSGQPLDFIRFRVIAITTLHSPKTAGEGQGELRLVTSEDAETFTNSQPRTVVIRGTILEFDCACEPSQPNGGGLNSSAYANLSEEQTIAPGEIIDVQFLFNVVHAGAYRVYVYVEAEPTVVFTDAQRSKTTRRPLTMPPPPIKLINLGRTRRVVLGKRPKNGGGFPTKSGTPQISPSVVSLNPGRTWIAINLPTSSAKRHRRKTRVRRKSSAALRAKAEAKYGVEQKAAQN